MITISKANENQLINDSIKFAQVRLIDAEGNMIGVVPLEEAKSRAEEAELDLVCISPNPENPVCRIMDYKKFLFEKGKKEKEAKKKQKETELKEIGLKLTTDVHDIEVKRKAVIKFLSNGDRVKVNIRFRGREMAFQNKGFEVMTEFAKGVEEYQKQEDGALLIITHNTGILSSLKVDRTHVLVNGQVVGGGDASLVDEINRDGYEKYEAKAAE